MPSDKRKQSLYIPGPMIEELRSVADAQDRTLSWLMQRAWRLARRRIAGVSLAGAGHLPRYHGVGVEQRIHALLILRGQTRRAFADALGIPAYRLRAPGADLERIAEHLEVPLSTLTAGTPWPDVSNDDEAPSEHSCTA